MVFCPVDRRLALFRPTSFRVCDSCVRAPMCAISLLGIDLQVIKLKMAGLHAAHSVQLLIYYLFSIYRKLCALANSNIHEPWIITRLLNLQIVVVAENTLDHPGTHTQSERGRAKRWKRGVIEYSSIAKLYLNVDEAYKWIPHNACTLPRRRYYYVWRHTGHSVCMISKNFRVRVV